MKLNVILAGICSYSRGYALQKDLLRQRQQNFIPDTLLLLEHPPVLTMGRQADEKDILISQEVLREKGIEVVGIERGGEVTYHGPGQIVGYLFFHMDVVKGDVGLLISNIEEVFIRLLKEEYGITASRDPEHRGVWLGRDKITAVGIAIRKRVTMHGFAFNVNTDLSHFSWIVPCGIRDRGVTSLAKLLGRQLDIEEVRGKVIDSFLAVFDYSDYVLREVESI